RRQDCPPSSKCESCLYLFCPQATRAPVLGLVPVECCPWCGEAIEVMRYLLFMPLGNLMLDGRFVLLEQDNRLSLRLSGILPVPKYPKRAFFARPGKPGLQENPLQ